MTTQNWAANLAGLALSALVAGCGGGSSSSDPAPTPTVTSLMLNGTASRSTGLGGKAFAAKCAAGSSSGSTKSDGSYSIAIEGGKWPCLVRVTEDDGTLLHSIAQGSSSATSATANITPVTQLVVARFAGADPIVYYTAYDSAAAAFATTAAVANAQAAVLSTLKSGGVDLSAAGDVINAAAVSPAYATALVALDKALVSSGAKLADLTTAVVNTAPTKADGTAVIIIGVPSLPPESIIKPAASNCAAVRSGKYRVVIPAPGAPLNEQADSFDLNASTGVSTDASGSVDNMVPDGACRYRINEGKDNVVVSPAGVMVARIADGAKFRIAIAFPEQLHALAELAGTWSGLGMNAWDGAGGFGAVAATVTLGSDGKISTGSACSHPSTWDVSACASFTPSKQALRVNAAGGFDLIGDSGKVEGRSFIYQSGSGDLMYVQVRDAGEFNIWTKQRVNSLPSVAQVKTNWSFGIDEQMLSSGAITADTNTVVSIDAAAGSWVRKQKSVGGTDEHSETWLLNSPRDGYNYRAAGTALAADGSTLAINQVTSMGLRGMGVTAVLNQSKKRFQLSVEQPAP